MSVTTPWMLVTGCTIIGWLAPEIFAAVRKGRIPADVNVLGAIAGGLIGASFVV